jgi:plasmid stabilization system protein ParE
MSAFRLSPEAEDQLDGIWLHIARDSRSIVAILYVFHGSRDIEEFLAPAARFNPTAFQAVSFQQPIPRLRQ